MTEAGIVAYAEVFDPQAMHTDAAAGEAGPFGKLVASGWHTLSLTMRLMVEARPFGDTPLIGMGVDEIRFARPVTAGMRLHAEAEVVEVRASTRGDRGYVRMVVRTVDEGGEVVASQVWSVVVPGRGAGRSFRV